MSDANGLSRSTVQLAATPGRPFGQGHDPRRNAGGRIRPEVSEFREAMAVHLPTAIKVIGELLKDPEGTSKVAHFRQHLFWVGVLPVDWSRKAGFFAPLEALPESIVRRSLAASASQRPWLNEMSLRTHPRSERGAPWMGRG